MIDRFRIALLMAPLVAAIGTEASAQGFIVDHRHHVPIARSYEVRDVSVDARIRDQVAEVQVSQTFHNPGSFELESEFLFPLPDDGAIQGFVLLVDGRELPGRLLPKDEARRIFEEIVRTKRDPALLEFMGRGLFKTSVFPIPPGADRKVTMRYTQVCKRDRDVVAFSYPLATQKFTAKPIQKLTIAARIESRDPIKSLYSPSHEVEVRRTGDREASVRFEARDVVPSNDFRMIYTVSEGALGATVLSYRPSEGEDGYFLLLASPEIRASDTKPQPKTVIFTIDRSGSMAGKKIDQARNALKFVLENLKPDDLFNVVAYDDRVETFKPELQRYSPETRSEALRYVENIRPGGSTNIDEAVKASLTQIKDETRPNYVLFLTDGLPTAGDTRELAISEHAKSANPYHARLFAFGVGFDVNARLLDRLSGGNGGTSEYVTPDEDIESHVGRFYARMSSPVLSGLSIGMSGTDVNRTYPRDVPDLFEGGQLLWAGRYRNSGKTTVKIEGKVAGERRSTEFPAELAGAGGSSSYQFVETLWAVRRVGFIIDQIDLHGQNKELTDELVALSTKYGILTPYTSFLADERVNLHAFGVNRAEATESLHQLSVVDGFGGVGQRKAKQAYNQANRAADASYAKMPSVASAPAVSGPAAPASVGALGRVGSGGLGGRMSGMAAAKASADHRRDEAASTNMRQVGNKTFFRKDSRWVDSSIKAEDLGKAKVVEQFSDAYFDLARGQSAESNQFLTFEEPVTVELGGKVYRIDRPKAR